MNRIEKIKFDQPVLDRRFNFDHEELTSIELSARLNKKVDEIIDEVNGIDLVFESKEDTINIGLNRKLSPTGNFTGYLQGTPVEQVLTHLGDNTGKIGYLTNQFAGGQTGLVVDGGFFEGSGIKKNYDGGVF